MHVWRLKRLKAGLGLLENDSLIFTGILNCVVLLSGVLSIYYALEFPFLSRSQSVEVENTE